MPFRCGSSGSPEQQGDRERGKHHSYDTAPYSQNKVARYFVAATDTERVELLPNPESGRIEHDQYAWFDYDQAMAKLTPRVQEVLRWAANVTGHI